VTDRGFAVLAVAYRILHRIKARSSSVNYCPSVARLVGRPTYLYGANWVTGRPQSDRNPWDI